MRRVSDLGRVFAALRARLTAGDTLLVLSDYDGTLTPITRDPTDAWLPPEVRSDLDVLAGSDRVRVGIVSGRQLDDLRTRVGLPDVIYAGCHGLEIHGPAIAFRNAAADARRGALNAVACDLRERVSSIPGVVVEPKGLAVAVHYRRAAPGSVRRLEAELDGMTGAATELTLLRGKKVFEILPRIDWDKGRCALRIRDYVASTARSPVTTLYLGDDATDELAFWALDGRAITARVGGGPISFAPNRLRDVEEVHRLLSGLAAEVQRRRVA